MLNRFLPLRAISIAATLCLSAACAQAGVFFECDLDTNNPRGWVSQKMGFVFDDAGQVKVIDSVILHFVGEPLTARRGQRGDKNRITWNIAGARDSKGQSIPTFRYVANLNTATGALFVSAKPALAPQRWTARGTCKPRTARP